MRAAIGPLNICFALVASLGVVHGIYTDRWGPSGQLEAALATLPRVPTDLGDWVGQDETLEPEAMARGGIKGGLLRRLKNARTGETVSLLIVCGRGGPISVHTPDICYAGAGYQQLGLEQRKELTGPDGRRASVKVARFAKKGAVVPTELEIYWTWSRDGAEWQAPENPRLALARSPALYKLYVVREYAPKSNAETAYTCEAFLMQALPILRKSLQSTGS